MTACTTDELERIGVADELELTASGRAVTIWIVRVGGDLYVRSFRGDEGITGRPCSCSFKRAVRELKGGGPEVRAGLKAAARNA